MIARSDRPDETHSPSLGEVESSTEPRTKRIRVPHPVTLLLFGILLALCGLALALWLPVLQTRQLINQLEARGAVVQSQLGPHEWLAGWVDLPETHFVPRVVSVDLSRAEPTDSDLELLAGLQDLRMLAVYGPQLTDAGFEHLNDVPALQSLILIHCPEFSAEAASRLQASHPGLEIVRRGNAFLGVAGRTTLLGCWVNVVPNGSAGLAGMRTGDVILTFDEKPVPNFDTLVDLIAEHDPDDVVTIEAQRHDKRLRFETVLGRWR